jgi:anti-sigma regulatory factor (Ser/Thr protein kinase)
MSEPTTLILNNEPSELNRVTDLLASLCAEHAISSDIEYDVNLALDELVTNVIRHAFTDGHTHQFTVRISLDKDEFVAQIEDDGREFNPVAHPAPDLDVPLAERKLGGLGIHLVRNLMDGFEYARVGGKNLVTLRKKIGGNPAEPQPAVQP